MYMRRYRWPMERHIGKYLCKCIYILNHRGGRNTRGEKNNNLSDAGSDVAKVWWPFITDKLRVTTAVPRYYIILLHIQGWPESGSPSSTVFKFACYYEIRKKKKCFILVMHTFLFFSSDISCVPCKIPIRLVYELSSISAHLRPQSRKNQPKYAGCDYRKRKEIPPRDMW